MLVAGIVYGWLVVCVAAASGPNPTEWGRHSLTQLRNHTTEWSRHSHAEWKLYNHTQPSVYNHTEWKLYNHTQSSVYNHTQSSVYNHTQSSVYNQTASSVNNQTQPNPHTYSNPTTPTQVPFQGPPPSPRRPSDQEPVARELRNNVQRGAGFDLTKQEYQILNTYYERCPDTVDQLVWSSVVSAQQVGDDNAAVDVVAGPDADAPGGASRSQGEMVYSDSVKFAYSSFIARKKRLAAVLLDSRERWMDSCQEARAQDDVGAQKIIGADNRVMLSASDMDKLPFRTIGRFIYRGRYCTATLVGEYIALTSRHCLDLDQSGQLRGGFFDDAHVRFGESQNVWNFLGLINRVEWSNREDDWAIIQLVEPVGQFAGYLSVGDLDEDDFEDDDHTVTVVGYSLDLFEWRDKPSVHYRCGTEGTVDDMVLHNCDTFVGASGGPVLMGTGWMSCRRGKCNPTKTALPVLGGLHVGGDYDGIYNNYMKPSGLFSEAVANARDWLPPHLNPRPTTAPTTLVSFLCADGITRLTASSSRWRTVSDGSGTYRGNTKRCWLVDAGADNNVLELEFTALDFEFLYDYLDVYNLEDGQVESSSTLEDRVLVASLTGTLNIQSQTEFQSQGRYMLLAMSTDHSIHGQGFVVGYKSSARCLNLLSNGKCKTYPGTPKRVMCSNCSMEDCEEECVSQGDCVGVEFDTKKNKCTVYRGNGVKSGKSKARYQCYEYGVC